MRRQSFIFCPSHTCFHLICAFFFFFLIPCHQVQLVAGYKPVSLQLLSAGLEHVDWLKLEIFTDMWRNSVLFFLRLFWKVNGHNHVFGKIILQLGLVIKLVLFFLWGDMRGRGVTEREFQVQARTWSKAWKQGDRGNSNPARVWERMSVAGQKWFIPPPC